MSRREHTLHAGSRTSLRSFAAAVISARSTRRWDRRALATAVKVSYATISHIENAENWPTMPVGMAIIKTLKMGREFLKIVKEHGAQKGG